MRTRKPKCQEPNLFSLRCEECNAYLKATDSGYLSCPQGHGRLQVDGETMACGPEPRSLFDTSEES